MSYSITTLAQHTTLAYGFLLKLTCADQTCSYSQTTPLVLPFPQCSSSTHCASLGPQQRNPLPPAQPDLRPPPFPLPPEVPSIVTTTATPLATICALTSFCVLTTHARWWNYFLLSISAFSLVLRHLIRCRFHWRWSLRHLFGHQSWTIFGRPHLWLLVRLGRHRFQLLRQPPMKYILHSFKLGILLKYAAAMKGKMQE